MTLVAIVHSFKSAILDVTCTRVPGVRLCCIKKQKSDQNCPRIRIVCKKILERAMLCHGILCPYLVEFLSLKKSGDILYV